MPWYFPWSDSIKKRSCRYLLQRYLGQFLEEKLTLEQLSVDLYNGTGSVTDVALDVQALNEIGEMQNWPIEFVDGFISEIVVSIPWTTLLSDSSFVQVKGLHLTLQPKYRDESVGSMCDSVWSSVSMTSSMQLAEECLRDENIEPSSPLEGLELFAQAIDSILTRVKLKFVDSIIRFEYLPKNNITGASVEIHVQNLDYYDEASEENTINIENISVEADAFSTKHFTVDGVSLLASEFAATDRTVSKSVLLESVTNSTCSFYSATDEVASLRTSMWKKHEIDDKYLFAKLFGIQEVRLKIKRTENSNIPKIDLEATLGILSVCLTPSQLRVICELCQGFSTPHLQDTSNVTISHAHKPMTSVDFDKVERELIKQVSPVGDASGVVSRSLHQRSGWSSVVGGGMGEDSDEDFHPMKNVGASCSEEGGDFSSLSTSTNSVSSSVGSYGFNGRIFERADSYRRRRLKGNGRDDLIGEVNNYQISSKAIAVVILHTDVEDEASISTKFFENVNCLRNVAQGFKEFDNCRASILESISRNSYYSVLCANFVSNLRKRISSTLFSLTVANFDLTECLANEKCVEYVPILRFFRNSPEFDPTQSPMRYQAIPDISLESKSWIKCEVTSKIRREFKLTLQQCFSEIDITIIDRMSGIMSNFQKAKRFNSQENVRGQARDFSRHSEDCKSDFSITFPYFYVKFRFPIPNMSGEDRQDANNRRAIYDDSLILQSCNIYLHTCRVTHQLANTYEMQCDSIDASFKKDNDQEIPLATAKVDPNQDCGSPQVTVRIYPQLAYGELDDDFGEGDGATSTMNQPNEKPTPFAAKKVMRESQVPHNSGEEILLPGNKDEITNFIEDSSCNALLFVDLKLSFLAAQLPSKKIYELIYNRITTDLLLWSPASALHNSESSSYNDRFARSTFSVCNPIPNGDSDSDSDSEKKSVIRRPRNNIKQSRVAISVSATRAVVNLYVPSRNTDGSYVEGNLAHIQIRANEASVFIVVGHKGSSDRNYTCARINQFSLLHSPSISPDYKLAVNIGIDTRAASYLLPTLYAIDGDHSCSEGDMLTTVVEVNTQAAAGVKNIRVANTLYGATLRHRFTAPYTNWLTQLIDMFDVVDFPIPHYKPRRVITQLHHQFANCLVDYRPLNLGTRCAVSIDSFHISSNITAKTNSLTLRFIAEEAILYLLSGCAADVEECTTIDLKSYVHVADFGLFELSLRLADGERGSQSTDSTRIDLRASNNILHVRTCADSAIALMDLIKYIANDGDLAKENCDELGDLTSNGAANRKESQSEQEQDLGILPDLMEQAINDELTSPMSRKKFEAGAELFFFPNESMASSNDSDQFRSVEKSELCEFAESEDSGEDSDADYCLLDRDVMPINIDIASKNNFLPEVRMLTKNVVRVVDNHFSLPVAKVDVLKAPLGYPMALARYTLREMTLVWHMFAGNDFSDTVPNTTVGASVAQPVVETTAPIHNIPREEKMTYTGAVYHSIPLSRHSSTDSMCSASSIGTPTIEFFQRRLSRISSSSSSIHSDTSTNVIPGGVNRQQDTLMQLQLTKLKVQYEVYPAKTKHASRLVVVVQEVEIRDRLASSNINKFLYQYFSTSKPKQSHANMVVIKATNVRPEPDVSNAQECCLRVSLMPLRLNVDQDSLLFLIDFVNAVCDGHRSKEVAVPTGHSPVINVTPTKLKPSSSEDDVSSIQSDNTSIVEDWPLFIRSFVFSPEVPIRLDYEGKRVDMTKGPFAGLIMGLGQLNCSELKLKSICNRYGFLGLDKLLSYVLTEWTNDIMKTQLPSILGGVGPMYSLVQLAHGVRDLFWMPIEQYHRDGRIVRGLQRGANSFTTSTAIAALELTARIVYAIQRIAETAFDIVSPGPSVRCLSYPRSIANKSTRRDQRRLRRQPNYAQPANIREGVATALLLVREGLGETAQTLVRAASSEHETKGAVGAVGGVLRQIPSTALTPIILASQATTNVLGGVKSQLVPDARAEAALKWRNDYF